MQISGQVRAITQVECNRAPHAPQETLEMITDDSPCAPTFLDDDIPAELPLMVTRHTLRSLGLSLEILKHVDSEPDRKTQTDAGTC